MSNAGRHAFIPDDRGNCIANCHLPKLHEIHQGFPIEDPRIPYDPEDEMMRFEVVITRSGAMKLTLPPVHLEGMFWQAYRYLNDQAYQYFVNKKKSPLAL